MDDFELLLNNRAPINWTYSSRIPDFFYGMTPLMEASQNGFSEKVDLLLKSNYSNEEVKTRYINRPNLYIGLNALHLVCMNNHKEVVPC